MRAYHILILLALTILAVGCTEQQKIIGGDKDSHGCLIAAGYSWCEAKQECIRVFEENCTACKECPLLSQPSPSFCTNGTIVDSGKNSCGCNLPPKCAEKNESAQIANPASVNCINRGGKLEIVTDETGGQVGICTLSGGTKCEEWAFMRNECFEGIYSCSADADCAPKPGCHPRECINAAYSNKFEAPDACTMIFDCSAAYSKADCLCVNNTCTNKNLGNKGCSEIVTQ
jgi:putative hemolysin